MSPNIASPTYGHSSLSTLLLCRIGILAVPSGAVVSLIDQSFSFFSTTFEQNWLLAWFGVKETISLGETSQDKWLRLFILQSK